MPIQIVLDEMLASRGLKARQLAAAIGVSETHLSLFRTGKVKGVRFSTLASLCAALQCQPGDLLRFCPGPEDEQNAEGDEGE